MYYINKMLSRSYAEYGKSYYTANKEKWAEKYNVPKMCNICNCSAQMMTRHLKTEKHRRNVELLNGKAPEKQPKLEDVINQLEELKKLILQPKDLNDLNDLKE